jgi:CRISPR-associated endonuclease/helicase Cas3
LSSNYNCTIITATATQPQIIPPEEKEDLIEQHPDAVAAFNQLDRYQINFYPEKISLDDFLEETILPQLHQKNPCDLMIVLNTKRSATQTCILLDEIIQTEKLPYEIFYLSRGVIPADRIKNLEKIRAKLRDKQSEKKCLLVCTQIVEAGVDISFDCVYRDFAPLSSIIQVAGRCNRGMDSKKKGEVFVYCLQDPEKDVLYSSYIYDPIELEKTKAILSATEMYDAMEKKFCWNEIDVRALCEKYYLDLSRVKVTTTSLKYLYELKFHLLNETFKLIKDIPEITIFIKRDSKAKTLLSNIINSKKKVKSIPKQFYQYTLEISKKDFDKIIDDLEPYPNDEKPRFWILKSDYYYSSKWGLNPDK